MFREKRSSDTLKRNDILIYYHLLGKS